MAMNGLLGKKIGMTQVFDEAGNVVPVTIIEAGPCWVIQSKTTAKDGYNAVQLGFGKAKKLSKPKQGHVKETNARYLREIKLDQPADLQAGQEIKVEIFKPGEVVTVTGLTVGKGFAGVTKRWHHHRGPMSHGSKSHRIPGSIGAGTTPGRVYKGRRMPGHMGAVQATIKSVTVVQVDAAKNLLMIRGGVPGKTGNLLLIKKAAGK